MPTLEEKRIEISVWKDSAPWLGPRKIQWQDTEGYPPENSLLAPAPPISACEVRSWPLSSQHLFLLGKVVIRPTLQDHLKNLTEKLGYTDMDYSDEIKLSENDMEFYKNRLKQAFSFCFYSNTWQPGDYYI